MQVREPEAFHRAWVAAFNIGDIDSLMSLYTPQAVLVPQPGMLASGTDAIRDALAGLLALKPRMTIEPKRVLRTGDVALLYSEWHMRGTASDDAGVALAGQTNDVVVRQADGRWLIAIDNPFGADCL